MINVNRFFFLHGKLVYFGEIYYSWKLSVEKPLLLGCLFFASLLQLSDPLDIKAKTSNNPNSSLEVYL